MNRIDNENKCLRVSSEVMKQLRVLMDPANRRKIQAIKLLRSETRCGLKEAKNAVERKFQGPSGSQYSIPADTLDIQPLFSIKSITINFGEGDVVVDLEEMHMMTLMNMNQIGLSEVRRILDLHELIKGWEEETTDDITTGGSASGGN